MKFIFIFLLSLVFSNQVFAENLRVFPANKVLTFWDKYLALPQLERDGFLLKYKIRAENGGQMPKVQMVIGNIRKDVQIDKNGNIYNMPDLNNFKNTKFEIIGKSKIFVDLDAIPLIPLNNKINVSSIQNSLIDYKKGVKIGGPAAALIAPKLNSIVFHGVETGTVVFVNGNKIPLPKHKHGIIFTNDSIFSKASYIEFNIAPKSVAFDK